jgi:hypothetical protein
VRAFSTGPIFLFDRVPPTETRAGTMSFYATEIPELSRPSAEDHRSMRRGSENWPWIWMGLVCVLFGASGAARAWQDHRFQSAKNRVITPIFPLKDLPKTVGRWRALEGLEASLDPRIAQMAGSVDSLMRVYVNEDTGVTVTALLIYGRAEAVVAHTPEVCYPAVGYQIADDVATHRITFGDANAFLRSTVYAKKGVDLDLEEVFYSIRHDGRWSPSIDGNWKVLRFSPAVFKLQIQRRVVEGERRHLDNPSLDFLKSFIVAFERKVAAESAAPTSAPRS